MPPQRSVTKTRLRHEDWDMTHEAVRRIAEGRNADLIPTPLLSPDEFEDFVERLLSAHRFCPAPLLHVSAVERWGRKGDKQDGIDFQGSWSDGESAAWQCKRQDSLTAANVAQYVAECTFVAERYILAFSGEASDKARTQITNHPGWELLDQRGLGRMLQDLPLHKRREVLDSTWGLKMRRRYLRAPGEDAFLSIGDVMAWRRSPDNVLNDMGAFVGRDEERKLIASALDHNADWPAVLLVSGAGGAGKSRIVAESLYATEKRSPQVTVLSLASGRRIDTDALKELPFTPAVIFADDVHRDPDRLAPLIEYQKSSPETQLVLASRGQGVQPIRSLLIRAGLRDSQIQVIELSELTYAQARAMVTDLSAGLDLQADLIEHLTVQAQELPYVAVIALNLARRGELQPGYLRLDAGIRRQILARYEDLLIGEPAGYPPAQVTKMLATVSALGTLRRNDSETLQLLAGFIGLELISLLRLVTALEDRSVLVEKDGVMRIVPEVLADQVLENEAIALGIDTGFVSAVWETFGTHSDWQLLTNLASLEWRLTSSGSPSVVGPIWKEINQYIAISSLVSIGRFLGASAPLAFSQPARYMEVLLTVQERLGFLRSHSEDIDEDDTYVAAWGGLPASVEDVELLLPKQYAECARRDPSLLELALDGIWILAKRDSRPPHQFPDHPVRVIADRLADIGTLADASFPTRIIERVRAWLSEPAEPGDIVTPMSPLGTLLAKEGYRTKLADRRSITFEDFHVDAKWARPMRDSIRELLVEHGLSTDVRRSAAAVQLLTDALRPAHGLFGHAVRQEVVDAWDKDDLATLEALERIGRETTSSLDRRLVRRGIDWYVRSENGVSEFSKRAYLLLYELDQYVEDDLVEILLPNHHTRVCSQRGLPSDFSALLDESKSHDIDRWELNDSERRQFALRVADSLWSDQISQRSLTTVARAIEAIALTGLHNQSDLATLFSVVAVERPQYLPELIHLAEITSHPAVDAEMHWLLVAWLTNESASAVAYLASFDSKRDGVRLAIGRMFSVRDLGDITGLSRVLQSGVSDPEDHVRQAFLASLGSDLVARPIQVATLLLEQEASPGTIHRVITSAWQIDPSWGSKLEATEAPSVVKLIIAGGWEDWIAQQLLINLVETHAELLMSALLTVPAKRLYSHTADTRLVKAFDEQPETVASWLIDGLIAGTDSLALNNVITMITGGTMQPRLSTEIAAHVVAFNHDQLNSLIEALSNMQAWAATSPGLARTILVQARNVSTEFAADVAQHLMNATSPTHWSGSEGVSAELAMAAAANDVAAHNEQDIELKKVFETSAKYLHHQMRQERQRYESDL